MQGLMKAALAAWGCSMALAATAQSEGSYPQRPIQLVIPFAPGDTDQMLRPVVDKMPQYLKQPLVMNYKPGAGGGIGAAFVAAAAPDGYTLLGSSPGALVVVPQANKEAKYRSDSFRPVAAISLGGMMIVVPAKSSYRSLKDLVADAKARPDMVSYGTSGALGINHLLGEIFATEAGLQLRHIPFQGSTPAVTALLGGHTEAAISAIGPARAHIEAGALRPLAVFSDKRMSAYPEVPTLRELGYDIGSPALYGLVAPAQTPTPVVDALYRAIRSVVDEHGPDVASTLQTMGAEIGLLGPQEYAAYLAHQEALFARGLKMAGQ
ncbi:Bug family tripartite tricarboxylate transporter substrate binding protein [Bordetella trematum]|uniref:Bug family tripartite tricarboxylate transporter substrate binding protein n=1 Tax=Bordetella trematum TaxID=123899 RepID=UPI000D91FE18|nr:tripartite tricarboxylate transporter substrate binding protein [Bordetella trematum]SPU49282.1 putattive exported protein [Bordetella trematum]VDH03810.1 Argininosuccinate lyase [Bordetella trematum]